MLDALRRVSERDPERFNSMVFRSAHEAGELVPTTRAYHLRFGSWNEACRRAGVRHGASTAARYNPWTESRCVAAIRQVAALLGAMPSIGDYTTVRTCETDLDLPSHATIRGRCGGWARALELAESSVR